MGIGLSVPWLLVAFFPTILNYFPKPGKWMVIFKKVLGIGMLITAFWIISILLSSYNSIFDSSTDHLESNVVIKWEKGLANFLAEKGETVIVDITADWCLTCKLNKIVIFNTEELMEGINNGKIKVKVNILKKQKESCFADKDLSPPGPPGLALAGPHMSKSQLFIKFRTFEFRNDF